MLLGVMEKGDIPHWNTLMGTKVMQREIVPVHAQHLGGAFQQLPREWPGRWEGSHSYRHKNVSEVSDLL